MLWTGLMPKQVLIYKYEFPGFQSILQVDKQTRSKNLGFRRSRMLKFGSIMT